MKKIKVLFISALLGLSFVGVQASSKAISHCKPFINLAQLSGQFGIQESVNPPAVNKKIEGTYTCVDINGLYDYQMVSGSIQIGQLSRTYYAPSHFHSYKGSMSYYYNGIHQGSISKLY